MTTPITRYLPSRPTVLILLVVMLLGAITGGVAAQLAPRSFQATSRLYVSSSAQGVQDLRQGVAFTQQVTESYADVATTPLVLGRVIDRLGLTTTPRQLAKQVSARVEPHTAVIAITVSDRSSALAARVANTVGTELAAVASSLSPTGTASNRVELTLIEPARAATASSESALLLLGGLGAALGLVIALVILWFRSGRPKPPTGSWRVVWQPRMPGDPA